MLPGDRLKRRKKRFPHFVECIFHLFTSSRAHKAPRTAPCMEIIMIEGFRRDSFFSFVDAITLVCFCSNFLRCHCVIRETRPRLTWISWKQNPIKAARKVYLIHQEFLSCALLLGAFCRCCDYFGIVIEFTNPVTKFPHVPKHNLSFNINFNDFDKFFDPWHFFQVLKLFATNSTSIKRNGFHSNCHQTHAPPHISF